MLGRRVLGSGILCTGISCFETSAAGGRLGVGWMIVYLFVQ